MYQGELQRISRKLIKASAKLFGCVYIVLWVSGNVAYFSFWMKCSFKDAFYKLFSPLFYCIL
uniref:Uncharacterized protein n=1 Tax=Anguilla anguilla TaxID=7936 RepID=A0A0E9WGT0_ANGAN